MTSEVIKGHLKIQNHHFLRYNFCLKTNIFFQEYQHYEDANFSVIEGHPRSKSF